MELHFVDFKILINGCYLDRYNIENGERVDFLCITDGITPFDSFIACNDLSIISNNFDILIDDKVALLFIKKHNYELQIFLQHTFAFDMTNGLVSVYKDGHNYISIESDSGYNIIELPIRASDFLVSTNNYGDILYLTYYVDGCKTLSVYNLRSLKCIETIKANNIDIDDNTITCYIERKDILLRKSTIVYEVRDGKCNKISNSFECTNVHVYTDALIGVLFLEAMVSADFDRILNEYLSDELKDDFEGIMSLFEGILEFTPMQYRDNVFIVEFLDKRSLMEFIYRNGKIADILID